MTVFERLVQALRRRSLSTFFMELLVLTLGVFLGFQVDRWYENYRDSQTVDVYLDRLISDVEEDISVLNDVKVSSAVRLEAVNLLVASLSDAELVEQDPTAFVIALEQATYRFQMVARDATFQELVSTGLMTLLPEKTRGALYEYYAHISSYAQFKPTIDMIQAQSFERFAGVLTPDLYNDAIIDVSAGLQRSYTQAQAQAAAERFWAKPEAIEWLGRMKQAQIQMGFTAEMTLERAETVLGHLKCVQEAGSC